MCIGDTTKADEMVNADVGGRDRRAQNKRREFTTGDKNIVRFMNQFCHRNAGGRQSDQKRGYDEVVDMRHGFGCLSCSGGWAGCLVILL